MEKKVFSNILKEAKKAKRNKAIIITALRNNTFKVSKKKAKLANSFLEQYLNERKSHKN